MWIWSYENNESPKLPARLWTIGLATIVCGCLLALASNEMLLDATSVSSGKQVGSQIDSQVSVSESGQTSTQRSEKAEFKRFESRDRVTGLQQRSSGDDGQGLGRGTFQGQGFGGLNSRSQGFRGQGFGGRRRNPLMFDRSEFPMWEIDPQFGKDVFTFVRIKTPARRGGRRDWSADYPDADFYFSFRLQQLTSLQVDPHPLTLELTDPKLCDHPFAILTAPQSIDFSEAELEGLRKYLRSGGFIMVDEFFGRYHWGLFYDQLKRAFPQLEPKRLDLSHDLFHMVYDFDFFPQVTAIHFWQRFGITYHPVGDGADEGPQFFGLHDEHGRMMMLLCYNNDLLDGWEREGEDREFFEQFSVRQSYPMGINIVTYALTY